MKVAVFQWNGGRFPQVLGSKLLIISDVWWNVAENEQPEEILKKAASWRTFLFMFGSALAGGTAVALWNKRALSEIQGRSPARQREPLDPDMYKKGETDDAA